MLSNHNKEVHKEFKARMRNKEQLLEELTLNRLQISPVFIFDHSTWRSSSSVKPMARYQQHKRAEEILTSPESRDTRIQFSLKAKRRNTTDVFSYELFVKNK